MTQDLRYFPLYTTEARGVLYVPARMSRADIALLKGQIANAIMIISEVSINDPEPPELPGAIAGEWKEAIE